MIDDPNPVLRAELQAAEISLSSQVRGLQDLAKMSRSVSAANIIGPELVVRQRRLNLIIDVLNALDLVGHELDELYADGYPNFAPVIGVNVVLDEIQGESGELQDAAEIFKLRPISIGLDMANIVHTPQPIPSP